MGLAMKRGKEEEARVRLAEKVKAGMDEASSSLPVGGRGQRCLRRRK